MIDSSYNIVNWDGIKITNSMAMEMNTVMEMVVERWPRQHFVVYDGWRITFGGCPLSFL